MSPLSTVEAMSRHEAIELYRVAQNKPEYDLL